MTSTMIIMTTGRDRGDRLGTEKNRFVEPPDMSNFSECTLQVLEMQGGRGITNAYRGICARRVSRKHGFTQKTQRIRQVRKDSTGMGLSRGQDAGLLGGRIRASGGLRDGIFWVARVRNLRSECRGLWGIRSFLRFVRGCRTRFGGCGLGLAGAALLMRRVQFAHDREPADSVSGPNEG